MKQIRAFFDHIGRKIRSLLRGAGGGAAKKPRSAGEEDLFPEEAGQTRRMPAVHVRENGEIRLFGAPEDSEPAPQARERENEPLFVDTPRRRPFVLSVLFTSLRLVVLGLALLLFAGAGLGVGVAMAYVETTPSIDTALLTKSDRTSYLYDKNGQLITTIANLEYRDWVSIDQIPDVVQNAFIAVEDVRFYKHNGVDVKRLFSAALEVLGNSNSSGGSTITQQLIKNTILGSERNYKRKIQEAYMALELEKEISKQQILEAYLNEIHLGESNYGVKAAAKDYFGKDLDQLTVREAAMLAGLTTNPYYYNPRKNMYKREPSYWEATMRRTDTVLERMYQANFITSEQYRQALKEDVRIVEVSTQNQMYQMPYFVEYAIHDVVTHLLEKRGLPESSRAAVENELRTSGYHIYTTVDPAIQNTVQDTLAGYTKYPQLKDPTRNKKVETLSDGSVIETVEPQASAVVFDYKTGELRAIVGGRNSPTIRKALNRAYQSYMEVGSAIKPLAVYGPALDNGASPATVIANMPGSIPGWGGTAGYPNIGSEKYIGPLTVREGVVQSLNVMAARTLFERVTPEVSAKYLQNLGANVSKINVDGPGLALGTSGLTTIQMAAAYGAIADGGEYKEPLSFTRVVDSNGNVILDADEVRDTHRVFKESTAYMLVDILTDAVKRGTGTEARISGMTVAGKTGTNSDYRSVYFAGMTPYYTAAVWIGHDDPSPDTVLKDKSTGGKYAAALWEAFMEKIHKGLPDKSILDVSPASLGLVKKTVCSVSGKLATDACYADPLHKPVTDWFLESDAPAEECDLHAAAQLGSAQPGFVQPGITDGQQDTTGAVQTGGSSVVLVRPGSYYDQFPDDVLLKYIPNAVRTAMTVEEYEQSAASQYYYPQAGANGVQSADTLRANALALAQTIKNYISANALSPEDISALMSRANSLEQAAITYDTQLILNTMIGAQLELNRVQSAVSSPAPASVNG